MREILFRGKRIDNGEWVEGAYCKHDTVKVCLATDDPKTKHLILQDGFCDWGFEPPLCAHEVDPNTVGQYTGLTDKNGKKIFEGDIAREVWGERVFPTRLVVAMDPKRGGWFPFARGDGCGCCEQDVWDKEHTEIIGNIHDNSELLK